MSAVLEQPVVDTPESLRIELPVTGELLTRIKPTGAVAVAHAYEIDSPEMAQLAANERTVWAKRIDAIKAMRKDFVEPAQTILERAKKWFNPPIEDLEAGRELLGQKLLAWDQAEKVRVAREQAEREAVARRLRQEAAAKAAAELAKAEEVGRQARQAAAAAEAERARQAAEAERLRKEGDAKAAAEADRKAKAAAAEQAKQQEREQAAAQNGAATAGRIQLEAAAAASSQAPVQEVVKIAGQSTKENWVAVLNDGETEQTALVKIVTAIVMDKREDLLALLLIDTAAKGPLNRLAAAQKKHMRVPGYRAEDQPVLAGKRK